MRRLLIRLLGGVPPKAVGKSWARRWADRLVLAMGGSVPEPARPSAPDPESPVMARQLGLALKSLAKTNLPAAKAGLEELEALKEAAVPRPAPTLLGRARRFLLALGDEAPAPMGDVKMVAQEALGGSLLGDRGTLTQNEDIGFRPITERAWGKRTRDLTILSHREAINVSLWQYSSNPLAAWIIDTLVALTVGKDVTYGVTINEALAIQTDAPDAVQDPDKSKEILANIRTAIDKFWYHPAHNVGMRAGEYARTFMVTGHLTLPVVGMNKVDGCPQMDLVDAFQITGVNPLGGSAIVPGFVRFTPFDAGAVSAAERAYKVLLPDPDLGTFDVTNPVTTNPDGKDDDTVFTVNSFANLENPMGVKIVGECLYFKNSKLLNSMRGMPFLTQMADWLDALDTFMWSALDRAKLRNNVVWHLKLKGLSDDKQIQKKADELTASLIGRSGSVYASNEQAELDPLSAKLEARDSTDLGQFYLTHILGAAGMPESWYARGGGSTRATAGEQTDVTYKRMLDLQDLFRNIFKTLLFMAYDCMQAKQPSKLPSRSEAPWLEFKINLPIIQERDTSRMAAAAAQLAVALESANQSKFISRQTSRRVFLGVAGQITSETYEADLEDSKIQAEEQEDQAAAQEKMKQQQEMAKAVVGKFGQPGQGQPMPPGSPGTSSLPNSNPPNAQPIPTATRTGLDSASLKDGAVTGGVLR